MIIWLPSYPRSGNTYMRLVWHQVTGLPTYAQDPGDDHLWKQVHPEAGELIGHKSWSPDRGPDTVQLVKTHVVPGQHPGEVQDVDYTLYLVRDGRDAVVSDTYFAGGEGDNWSSTLDRRISQDEYGWSAHVAAWIMRGIRIPTVVVRFEHLIALNSRGCRQLVRQITRELKVNVPIKEDPKIPTFEELHAMDPRFFRAGRIGTWEKHFTESQEKHWMKKHGLILRSLGYD